MIEAMSRTIEIEHTYLVKELPKNLEQFRHDEIRQGYVGPKGYRLRSYNNERFEKTIKRKVNPNDRSTSSEETEAINRAEFKALWNQCNRTIAKTRYYISIESGFTAELDLFHGPIEGFVMVEVEFRSREQAAQFIPPSWFGVDITQQDWAINYELAALALPELKQRIKDL